MAGPTLRAVQEGFDYSVQYRNELNGEEDWQNVPGEILIMDGMASLRTGLPTENTRGYFRIVMNLQ